jgi:hypothetical protein
MQGQFNPKITGAIIVGLALVGGAYTVNSFDKTPTVLQGANTIEATAVQRAPITVSDNDQNGIEDWRDEFLTEAAIVIPDGPLEEYVAPTTLTGQTGIRVAESIIQSRTMNFSNTTDEDIVKNTVDTLSLTAKINLWDAEEINIMTIWDDQDIVNYANTVAAIIYRNNNEELGFELEILNAIVNEGSTQRVGELETLARVYRSTLEDTLKIPVPDFLAKQHLDLINTYQAITEDLEGMLLSSSDPIVALIHLKRYRDDAPALGLALENMYFALEPHAILFSVEDPALFFAKFSPDYQP